jgi:Bacteriophage tail sheath protein
MPVAYKHPGVYVEEIPSEVRPIAGVSTSDTAFVGFFPRGPILKPTKVTSFTEFERRFGSFDTRSEAAYQVQAFFANGGSVAWIVRVVGGTGENAPKKSTKTFDNLVVTAIDEGAWGDRLRILIDYGEPEVAAPAFNLTIQERVGEEVVASELHNALQMDPAKPRFAPQVIEAESRLVRASRTGTTTTRPSKSTATEISAGGVALAGGKDGTLPTATQWNSAVKTLDDVVPEVFNLLCLAGASDLEATGGLSKANYKSVVDEALTYCEKQRAFLVVDTPSDVDDLEEMKTYRGSSQYPSAHPNGAMYFPRIEVPDPLVPGSLKNIGPCGTVAGAFARTDALRGVWKAPAGTDVAVRGASLQANLDDARTGDLNVMGVNVMRALPIYGTVVWGARTLKGADAQADPWKYIPVRRMALYIEQALYQGLTWVTFEPNDEPLWASIRLNVGAFMNGLFRQGAFAGATTRDAYFVKCDKETTTEDDVNRGVVNIIVGFRPLKPAEFVVLKIQQMAGQAAT